MATNISTAGYMEVMEPLFTALIQQTKDLNNLVESFENARKEQNEIKADLERKLDQFEQKYKSLLDRLTKLESSNLVCDHPNDVVNGATLIRSATTKSYAMEPFSLPTSTRQVDDGKYAGHFGPTQSWIELPDYVKASLLNHEDSLLSILDDGRQHFYRPTAPLIHHEPFWELGLSSSYGRFRPGERRAFMDTLHTWSSRLKAEAYLGFYEKYWGVQPACDGCSLCVSTTTKKP